MRRTKLQLTFGLLFLALVACATPSPQLSGDGGPTDVSISEIHKAPQAWHDKLVQVTGTFDECISYNCNVCETEEALVALNEYYESLDDESIILDEKAERMCMRVSFYNKHYPPENERVRAFLESTLTLPSTESDKLVRFTTSTIVATFDASCHQARNSGTICVRTDRAPDLENAKIVDIHIQRPSSAGVINQYGVEPLGILDSETNAAISEAYDRSRSHMDIENEPPDFVFVLARDDDLLTEYGISALGGVCECLEDACKDADWPKRAGDTWIKTPANPYVCWQAELVDGVWRFPLQ